MPTLRQRIAESPGELDHLVKLLVARITGVKAPELVGMVLEAFNNDLPHDYAWPGNVRELEQAVRRVLLTGHYVAEAIPTKSEEEALLARMRSDKLSADGLLGQYGKILYKRFGKYTEVAAHMGLDVRTVKKYVES
jgi:transcriptional regulator with GAF, ATPase, and Fis domain